MLNKTNIQDMLVTLNTSQLDMSPLNAVAQLNIPVMSVTLDTSQSERAPLNDVACMNMRNILVTLDTSHFDISPLKECALANIPLMLVTLDTSHSAIGPCGPLKQSPLAGDNLRHMSTAPLSSTANENAGEVVHTVRDIDPDEPANMPFLLAFELVQAAPQSYRLNDAE